MLVDRSIGLPCDLEMLDPTKFVLPHCLVLSRGGSRNFGWGGVTLVATPIISICSRNALGALVASVSQDFPPWVGARGNGFYGIDPLNTSLRKYGQQALLRRPTVFNGNNGNKDTSKEGRTKKKQKKNPLHLQHNEQYNKVTDNTDKPNDEISSLVHSEFLSIISIPFSFHTLPGYYHCTSLIPAYTDDFHFVFSTN